MKKQAILYVVFMFYKKQKALFIYHIPSMTIRG